MNFTPDEADLAALAAALDAHDRGRRASVPAGSADRRAALLRGVALTLLAAPPEPGAASPACDSARILLRDPAPDDLPEAQVAGAWLAGAPAEWESLARGPLWPPAAAMAYQALAHAGRRRELADLLPADGPLNLAQADAWLDAAHSQGLTESWKTRILPDDPVLPLAVREDWAALLAAEAALAVGESAEAEAVLNRLANSPPGSPRTYAEAVARRVAARAAAALVRVSLGRFRPDLDRLRGAVDRGLLVWEAEYLRGLACGQLRDAGGAEAAFRAALVHNPEQTGPPLALAAQIAEHSPDAALEALACRAPTLETLVASAALLARLGRLEEAERALGRLDEPPAPGGEPVRLRWPATSSYRRQAELLRAALAERRGDWAAAGRAWNAACRLGPVGNALQWTRKLFIAEAEVKSLAGMRGWRRETIEQNRDQARRTVGTRPLIGDPLALFFRAAALARDEPERAGRDLQALARQRSWLERERCVGGGRLLAVGDLLLALDRGEEAVRVYERAGPSPAARERHAAALVYTAVRGRAAPEAIAAAANRAAGLMPDSPWPPLLAAVGLLAGGRPDLALSQITAAAQRGAPGLLCRCLTALASGGEAPEASADEFAALRLPPEIGAALGSFFGSGGEAARLAALARALGGRWADYCPTDPVAAAARLLAAWCDDGAWEEALPFADALARSGRPGAREMGDLVRLRYALERAGKGEFEEAERELAELENPLPPEV